MSATTKYPALKNKATYLKTIEGKDITLAPVSVSAGTVGQSGVTPLAPQSVSAVYSEGIITISVVVYVDVDDAINSLNIYEKPTFNTTTDDVTITTKPLYIVYNAPEVDTKLLYKYSFSFTISDLKGSIDQIESYLEDTDPVTSRGTTTTVKKEMI